MATSLYEYYPLDTLYYWEDTFRSIGAPEGKALLAQTFTIGTIGLNQTHTLESVKLNLLKIGAPAGDLTIEIRSTTGGLPDRVLATGTISIASISAVTADWYTCSNFIGNTTLTASTKYAIVINHLTTATDADKISWNGSNETDGTTYSGGSGYWSQDSGATWTSTFADMDLEDFTFQCLGDDFSGTLCTYQDVVNKCGSGANATARTVMNVSNYVQQIESIIAVRTRRDWVTGYAALDANVKYVLNKIASSLAAIEVINYDSSGYTSRLEADGMINTLKGDAEMLLYTIKDKNTQAFMDGL